MEKPDFYKILCSSTPEEINKFISDKGTKKMVNAVTFIDVDSPYYNKEENTQSKIEK